MNKLKAILEQLRALDPDDPGRWPLAARLGTVLLTLLVFSGVGYYFLAWKSLHPSLDAVRDKETELWATLESKARKAANLQAYKVQLAEMERSFGTMLRQLPNKTEVPNLRHLADGSRLRPRGKTVSTAGRGAQGLLRRTADQHSPDGWLSRDGALRERYRRAAAYRDAA